VIDARVWTHGGWYELSAILESVLIESEMQFQNALHHYQTPVITSPV